MPVLYLFLDKNAKILTYCTPNRHTVIKSEKQSVFLAHTVVAVKQLKVVSAQYDDDSVIAPELVLVTPQFSMRVAKKWL